MVFQVNKMSQTQIINEGKAKVKVFTGKISKELPVFYNPVMKFNRDISVLLLNAIKNKNLQVALPLSGSGVRGIRFLLELDKKKIKSISFNDKNPASVTLIQENLRLNELKDDKISITNKDANQFLLDSKGFDYIDIDPFGSPNPFLNNAILRLSRKGILAVTATDTSNLAGSFPKACARNYWAKPLRNYLMHEVGIRILIRKVQLVASQFDKALTPILSYSKDHYYRIFFRCEKGKQKADEIVKQHRYLLFCNNCLNFKVSRTNHHFCCNNEMEYAGPLWTGNLKDTKLVNKLESDDNFVELLKKEVDVLGFIDIHALCKKLKKSIPPAEDVLDRIKESSRTQFSRYGFKTKLDLKEFIRQLF